MNNLPKALLFFLATLLLFLACGNENLTQENPTPPLKEVTKPLPLPGNVKGYAQNGTSWSLEVVARTSKRARGLMFVEHLAEREGMVFLFSTPEQQSFYMFNCKIPLDMLFLDGQGKIVTIHHQVPPCLSSEPDKCPNYPSTGLVQVVVELAAGQAKANHMEEGQKILFQPQIQELLTHPEVD